jgi:peptidoglycan L-alanyl-D-glutamate endopeptidase CwlK
VSSRDIGALAPSVATMAQEFLRLCRSDPWLAGNYVTVIITCTWRSPEEQAALYARGRTKPGRIVTWAKPGQSEHNAVMNGRPAARAFDVVPLRAGKPVWGTGGNGIDEDPRDDATDDLEVWQRVGAIGERVGLSWAGRWPRGKREFPHFEARE